MQITHLIPALALAASTLPSTALANPISLHPRADDAAVKVTADQIKQIAPKSSSCSQASKPECATAEKAAEYISHSFATYKITSPAVAAALIATMAKESGEFEFARNKVPGVPGQGTRNMQSPEFNAKYLASLNEPAFAKEKAAAGTDKVKILDALVKYGDYDFGSVAWFITTQCEGSVKALEEAKADQKGWDEYVQCVGATATDGRLDYWKKAVQVLGVK